MYGNRTVPFGSRKFSETGVAARVAPRIIYAQKCAAARAWSRQRAIAERMAEPKAFIGGASPAREGAA